MPLDPGNVQRILEITSAIFRGPGGGLAVLKDGECIAQHVWGYADMDRKVPMTAGTLMPICSISKQMFCAVLLDLEKNPPPELAANGSFKEQLTKELHQELRPEVAKDTELTIDHLVNNQSGFRDYWVMTTLWGAFPDGKFSIPDHGPKAFDRMRSLHFKTGTEFSYSNTNFYMVARLIERLTGKPFADLLRERLFNPAGMTTAILGADTAKLPPPCIGYCGDEEHGFVPAQNRIEWSGDGGVVASLKDMIAYDQYIDKCNSDAESWYSIATSPPAFSDGTPSEYGHGLNLSNIQGVGTVSHGGALDGFRSQRMYATSDRVSVITMFNHEANAADAAGYVLQKVLKIPAPERKIVEAAQEWAGIFFDPDLGLAITVKRGDQGEVMITYACYAERLRASDSHHASSRAMSATLDGDKLSLYRVRDHRAIEARRVSQKYTSFHPSLLVGNYYCAEADSRFHCEGTGHMLYGSFTGFLGEGPALIMKCLGEHLWHLSNPKGMDAPAPGDWTMAFDEGENGGVAGFTIGCWLARNLHYIKT